MGLVKAAFGSIGGAVADQWKEYFYCEGMSADVLVAKGQKRVSGRSTNRHGSDNIITDGSVIAVADGQCMMIVADGRIVEICAEPGEFTYDSGTQPSMFSDNLGDAFGIFWASVGERFAFGGEANSDQRVYYFNTKEIMGNKYGTANPVPFRVVDANIGLDIDIAIRCNGEYSYRITNPILFYTNVCGNVSGYFTRSQIDSQLKAELLTALQPAFANISERGIRYSALPGHTIEIAGALNSVLSSQWKEHRGIEVASFGINSMNASKEDERMIKELQRAAALRNPSMAAATLVGAQAQAMQDAAKNTGGAGMAFMGMNMAQGAGGVNAQTLYDMGAQQAATPQAVPNTWQCACGAANSGKFCAQCGSSRPAAVGSWQCACGACNTGKFCSECGSPRPADGWTCDCGATNTGKFCAECGKAKG